MKTLFLNKFIGALTKTTTAKTTTDKATTTNKTRTKTKMSRTEEPMTNQHELNILLPTSGVGRLL